MSAFSTPVPDLMNLEWHLASTWLLVLEIRGATGQLLPAQVQDVQMRIVSDTAVILDLGVSDCVSFPDPTAPYALVQVDPARQAGLQVGTYRYEARVIDASGAVFEIQYGALMIGASLFAEFTAPAPDQPGGELDFSDPANSGHVPGL